MTRAELITRVAKSTRRVEKEVEHVLEHILIETEKELVKGGEVVVRGFGKLEVVTQKARKARHINENKMIDVPEKKAIKFRPYKPLKTKVNG